MVIETNRRRFSYSSEGYFLNKKPSKQHIKKLMTYGIKHQKSPKEVLTSLKKAGVGYRKKEFLSDYARANATEYSKTHQAYDRATNFWGSVLNIKKRDGIRNYPTAVKKIKEFEKKDFAGTLTGDDIKELKKLSPDGEFLFGSSPRW